MNKIILIMVLLSMLNNRVNGQNNAGAIFGAAAAIAATSVVVASSVENIKEGLERKMVEWVLVNKNIENNKKFKLSFLKWDITKKSELSDVSILAFTFKEFNKNKEVLLCVCSPGWINDYGIDFNRILIYEITKEYWNKVLLSYFNISKSKEYLNISTLDSIPANNMFNHKKLEYFNVSQMTAIKTHGIEFNNEATFNFEESLINNGDTHIITDFDNNFKIDFNEGNLNMFIKETHDLVRIKRNFVLDLTKTLYEK
jgi:hypothetical protein